MTDGVSEGWLGLLERPDGGYSSELPYRVIMDGEEIDIPLLYPDMPQVQIDRVLAIPLDKLNEGVPDSIVRGAIIHARSRIERGLSPFKDRE